MEKSADMLFPDVGDDHSFVAHVENSASELGDGAYRQAFLHLTGADFDDDTSRRYWHEAMKHWRSFAQTESAEPALRTALFDYLHRVAGIIKNPRIVEAEFLDNLMQSSITDGLTGLYNQTHFKSCLNRLLDRVRQQSSSGGAVLLLDLDRFKQYNDRCGHLAGDEALRRAGQLITNTLRQCDLACRYGGEEFIILLPGADQERALTVADRIRRTFECTTFEGEQMLDSKKLTVSGGIALYPDNGLTATDLIDHADRELYQAKRRRNTISPLINDRQRAPRYNIRSLVEIHLPGTSTPIPALAFDISEFGIRIGCEDLDEPWDSLTLRFRRPFWPTDRELEALLCWKRTQDTGGMLMMGLEFRRGQESAHNLLPLPKGGSKTQLKAVKRPKPFPWMNC